MGANEKRRAQRKEVVLQASMTRDGVSWFSSDIEIKTLNLSRTGALITSPALLVPGEQCTMTVSKPGGGYGNIPVRVVWAEKGEKGIYRVGVAFRNLSPDEEYLVDLHLLRSAK